MFHIYIKYQITHTILHTLHTSHHVCNNNYSSNNNSNKFKKMKMVQFTSSSPSACVICHRLIAVTTAGLIRQHGPVRARRPGSGQSPANPSSVPESSQASSRGNGSAVSGSSQTLPGPAANSLPPDVFPSFLSTCSSVNILKRIPKASREQCGRKLAAILHAVVSKNDNSTWDRLFRFSARCLRAPRRAGNRRSLASAVNKQLSEEADAPTVPTETCSRKGMPPRQDPIRYLASRVSSKLEEGDFKGAVRLACSDDTLADMNEATSTPIPA